MKPHIRFDTHSRKWFAMAHRWANRPALIAHSFERLCEAMRRTHDRHIAHRKGSAVHPIGKGHHDIYP